MQAPAAEPAAEPVFHDNPLSGNDIPQERGQTYSSPMKPMMPASTPGYSQAGYSQGEPTPTSAGQSSYTSPASESVIAANAGIEQEVFASKAVKPESDALSTAAADSAQVFAPQSGAQAERLEQPIAPEGRGSYIEEEVAREIPGEVTSTPQLGGEGWHAQYQAGTEAGNYLGGQDRVAVSEPVTVEGPVAETAREVPVESGLQGTGPSLISAPTYGNHLPVLTSSVQGILRPAVDVMLFLA